MTNDHHKTTDPDWLPITLLPPDPKLVEFLRQQDERQQDEVERFNRGQQKLYQRWLTPGNR
jgi:hypothetical protein